MKEEIQEQKQHCCKFCNKRFSCGRSLGGHMRSHMALNSSRDRDERKQLEFIKDGHPNVSEGTQKESGSHVGYGLRENPKKSRRFSDAGDGDGVLQRSSKATCKDCGKEFSSTKSLHGHMRFHSDRNSHLLMEDSQSENEATLAIKTSTRKRRSRRRRFGSSPSVSCVSDGGKEQEQVAITLMMLSRGVRSWGDSDSVIEESSGKELVFFDVQSVCADNRTSEAVEGMLSKCGGMEEKAKAIGESKGLDVSVSEKALLKRKCSEFSVSKCELMRNGAELGKVDGEVDLEDGLKKGKINASDLEFVQSSFKEVKTDCDEIELKSSLEKTCVNCIEDDFDVWFSVESSSRVDLESEKCSVNESDRRNSCDAGIGRDSMKKIKLDSWTNSSKKDHCNKRRYLCTSCNKTFPSYQALGGHRASHKRIKGSCAFRVESSDKTVESDLSPISVTKENFKSCKITELIYRGESSKMSKEVNKTRVLECPICFKVFPSGQALGGHYRSHLTRSSANKAGMRHAVVIQHEVPAISDVLDLNLPAPIEDENNGFSGLNPWLIRSNREHEPLVQLFSN